MTRRWWFAGAGVLVLAVPLMLVWLLSHDAGCAAPPPVSVGHIRMMAALHRCYGSPQVLTLEEVKKPVPESRELLVKVKAAALNPLDWHLLRGTPYPARLLLGLGAPSHPQLGLDFAGVVEDIGSAVTHFKVGDEVFGASQGSFAQYVTVSETGTVALKPRPMSFVEAAAVPVAGLTALQALRDQGNVRPGDKVLINGASGGVGTYAVQIAKSLNAEVTGVCSTRNLDMVRRLGADHVIDYTHVDFTQGNARYDVIIDAVGNHSLGEMRHVLKPQGVVVMVGGPPGNWFGPLSPHIQAALMGPFTGGKVLAFYADLRQEDLVSLADLMQGARMKSFVERIYPLERLPEAMTFLETGHARGKVVIEVP